MSHGSNLIGTTIATAYETLGESGLQHSLNEPGCAAIFTNAELLPVVSKVVGNVSSLRLVIYDGKADDALVDKIRGAREGVKVLTLDELREIGRTKEKSIHAARPAWLPALGTFTMNLVFQNLVFLS